MVYNFATLAFFVPVAIGKSGRVEKSRNREVKKLRKSWQRSVADEEKGNSGGSKVRPDFVN